jgi:hypothetical protein
MQITNRRHRFCASPFGAGVVPPLAPPIESRSKKFKQLFRHHVVLSLQVIVTQAYLRSYPTLKFSSRFYDVAHREDRSSPFLDETQT